MPINCPTNASPWLTYASASLGDSPARRSSSSLYSTSASSAEAAAPTLAASTASSSSAPLPRDVSSSAAAGARPGADGAAYFMPSSMVSTMLSSPSRSGATCCDQEACAASGSAASHRASCCSLRTSEMERHTSHDTATWRAVREANVKDASVCSSASSVCRSSGWRSTPLRWRLRKVAARRTAPSHHSSDMLSAPTATAAAQMACRCVSSRWMSAPAAAGGTPAPATSARHSSACTASPRSAPATPCGTVAMCASVASSSSMQGPEAATCSAGP
mmetsp:Transcript_11303/g.28517  ORF Transcript_11303/g.28517 Transcript_11303/m.28517 type:complete len:275 (-) Transcript_11303:1216-2040(-)